VEDFVSYMVIVSAHGCEREARKVVRDEGYVTYQPAYRELVVTKGRKVWHDRLLFGRYFFARHDVALLWQSLPSLRQVAGLLLSSDTLKPSLVSDLEIDKIRAREDRSGYVTEAARNEFMMNQRVRACAGVMVGIEGRYDGPGRDGCDWALLPLFGAETRVEFAPGVLRAA
jgi:hypothetical protein